MLPLRHSPAILLTALLVGGSASTRAQQAASNSQTTPPASDDNSFPEAVSKAAAAKKKAAADSTKPGQAASQSPDPPAAEDNAFPEEISRKAAESAKAAEAGAGSGSGVSSSSDYDERLGGRNAVAANVPLPHMNGKNPVKEDLEVGSFYLKSGDFPGAYARFKEAAMLAPESTDAMFGLAEAARHLKKRDEALENYRLFLAVVPAGPKARDATKALAGIEAEARDKSTAADPTH